MNNKAPEKEISAYVRELRTLVDDALPQLVKKKEPKVLYDPVRYVLNGGGKRIRPVMVLLSAAVFGVTPKQALPAALAVEVFHTFTLVHDDIMDHASSRRGRETVHKKWDESTAILSGDFLMAKSYDLLAELETEQLDRVLHRYFVMVSKLCEGQALDKAFEVQEDVSVEEYLHMIDCKTGALLQFSLELGGLLGKASDQQLECLGEIGLQIGRAFQIQDDLLDLIADSESWGKVIGGDLIEGKKTYLLLSALERAQGENLEWFSRVIRERGLVENEVLEARERVEGLGVIEHAKMAVAHHTAAAFECVDQLPSGWAANVLRWQFKQMEARGH